MCPRRFIARLKLYAVQNGMSVVDLLQESFHTFRNQLGL